MKSQQTTIIGRGKKFDWTRSLSLLVTLVVMFCASANGGLLELESCSEGVASQVEVIADRRDSELELPNASHSVANCISLPSKSSNSPIRMAGGFERSQLNGFGGFLVI